MRQLRAPTSAPVILGPVFPNFGVQLRYQNELCSLINHAVADLLRMIPAAWAKTPPLFNSHIISGDEALTEDATAAGVIFRTSDDRVLLLHRKDGKGWAWPGGSIEANETAEVAARREAFEETLFPTNGWLELVNVASPERSAVRFATFISDIIEKFTPTLNSEHDAYEWVYASDIVKRDEIADLHPGVRKSLLIAYDVLATDAPSPTKALQIALARWGSQSIKRFDLMATKIADDFASRSMQATQVAMLTQLKKAGFTITFKPTMKSIEAYRLVVATNVGLIRNIPRKWYEQIEQRVWNAVRNGFDLHALSKELRETYGMTARRAALIARDQSAKAKSVIERTRRHELGIKKAFWMHSHAGKEPRPTHVKMNGKLYFIAKGMYDSAEETYVWPGELINCRCVDRAVIEGFKDAYEDVEIAIVQLQASLENAQRFEGTARAAEMREILQRQRDARRTWETAEQKQLRKQIDKYLSEG